MKFTKKELADLKKADLRKMIKKNYALDIKTPEQRSKKAYTR